MLLLKNCRLVPELTEGYGENLGDVLVEEGKISAIVPCGTVQREVCQQIDLAGKTLLPGLIDMHLHLHWEHDSAWSVITRPCWLSFIEYRYAAFMLDNGYTTIRDCGDDKSYASAAIRDAVKRRIVKGPRVVCAGPTLKAADANDFTCDQYQLRFAGTDDTRRKVRDNIMNGSNFIKLYGSGSLIAEGGDPQMPILEEDEIQEAVKIARSRKMYVAIHAHGREAIDTAVRCGVRTIEHASFITEETLQYMDGRRDVGLVPTVGLLHAMAHPSEGALTKFAKRIQDISTEVLGCIRNAYSHDILMGWGTDIALNTYQNDPYLEMRTRKEDLGFSNIDILKQLTINSAQLLMLDHEIGTIKEGKCADLVVIDGDPVADISAMYQKPVHVIRAGEIIR